MHTMDLILWAYRIIWDGENSAVRVTTDEGINTARTAVARARGVDWRTTEDSHEGGSNTIPSK